MIKVSIIVPIFRIKTSYLKECIESLIIQTCKEIEIILIDDGSKDECSIICDEYALLDSRINVIHQENQGVSLARNVGIRHAKGEWMIFVDGDDKAEPTMCEKIVSYAEYCNADIAMFSNYIDNGKEVYEHPFFKNGIESFSNELREEFQIRTMVLSYPGCSYQPRYMLIGHTFGKLIRSEFLKNSGVLFDPELLLQQDGIFYLRLSQVAGKIAYMDEPLYHYRVYDTSNCKKVRTDIDDIYNRVRLAYMDFIREYNKPKLYIDAFYAKCISDISQSLKSDFFNFKIEESLFHRLQRLKVFLLKEPFKTAIKCADRRFLTNIKRRNLFYYRHGLLWLLWLDWKLYKIKERGKKID